MLSLHCVVFKMPQNKSLQGFLDIFRNFQSKIHKNVEDINPVFTSGLIPSSLKFLVNNMFYNADQLLALCINMGGNRYNKLLAVKSLSFKLNRKNVSIWTISIYKSSRLKHETRMDTNRLGCKNSSQLKTTQSCRYSLTESVLSIGSSLTVVMLAFKFLRIAS